MHVPKHVITAHMNSFWKSIKFVILLFSLLVWYFAFSLNSNNKKYILNLKYLFHWEMSFFLINVSGYGIRYR